jgi:hypothetical protein
MPKADSTAQESVEQATTDILTPKRAPGKSKVAEDGNPSFEDRIVELQEYYNEHGHLRVPQCFTDGRAKSLGLWVHAIRRVYQRCFSNSSLLGEESPEIVLGPNKLSQLRIKHLEAMGFKWSVLQRNLDSSFEDRIAELREYYDEFGHLRVPRSCTIGRKRDLGVWIKRIREVYCRCLKNPALLGEESPGIILGPSKLSTNRIDQLEAMGLQWPVVKPFVPWEQHFQDLVAFKVRFSSACYRNKLSFLLTRFYTHLVDD